MLRLTLLRHAKSDWSMPALDDFDRPLNRRGQRNLHLMGKRLRKRGVCPELILSSDAVRAITTAQAIAELIGYPAKRIRATRELYLAAPANILDILGREGKEYTDIMVVGHNPGLTDLANRLCTARTDNIPTCGAFAVDLDNDNWEDLAHTQGTRSYFEYPKKKRV